MKVSSPRDRVLALAGGAALFGLVQAWLFRSIAPVPGIQNAGWFLNSGTGVGAVALAFAIAGALVGLARHRSVADAALVAAGAAVAMTLVLFSIGPGTIFPIVLVFGTLILGAATAMGVGLGMAVRRVVGIRQ